MKADLLRILAKSDYYDVIKVVENMVLNVIKMFEEGGDLCEVVSKCFKCYDDVFEFSVSVITCDGSSVCKKVLLALRGIPDLSVDCQVLLSGGEYDEDY